MPPRKDPNKPKGRTSAYAFYVKHRRLQYKNKGEEVAFKDFSKECSEMWKDIGEDEKEKFFKLAEEDRRRYDKEMCDYVPVDGTGKKGKRRKNKKKDPNMPKRGMSAFMWFAKDMRPKCKEDNPGATVGETAKLLGAMWQDMEEPAKAQYVEQQKKDRERYEREMAAYRMGGSAQATGGKDEDEEEEDEDFSDED